MKLNLLLLTAVITAGCVKVEVKPEEIVSDAVNASKSVYSSVQRKRDGLEERRFSHKMAIEANTTDPDTARNCLIYLRQLVNDSSENKAKILEESTELIKTDNGKTMVCHIRAAI